MQNIKIILVETSHPGNIGSAARAMKTMGLERLCLVKPKEFPAKEAEIMASNATSVLESAEVVPDLATALKGCELIAASSARMRYLDWPVLDPHVSAKKIQAYKAAHSDADIAVVFGRERTGLTNQELQQSHFHVHIPANPEYSSLNLAQAVQVMCYELRMAHIGGGLSEKPLRLATNEANRQFYQHLEEMLIAVKYLNPKAPKQLMNRLQRLFQRAQLEQDDINLLRGIFDKTLQRVSSSC